MCHILACPEQTRSPISPETIAVLSAAKLAAQKRLADARRKLSSAQSELWAMDHSYDRGRSVPWAARRRQVKPRGTVKGPAGNNDPRRDTDVNRTITHAKRANIRTGTILRYRCSRRSAKPSRSV
ncbi:hypothetical protein OKW30_002761 [Paraburkholderia sp. Clong3]